mgnify:CR=1 FL=1
MFDHNESLEQARQRNINDALLEDIGKGDWTAMLVPDDGTVTAKLIVRQEAVLCGQAWFEGCLKKLDSSAQIKWSYNEGDLMKADTAVCEIIAKPRALLSAERPAINFLQTCFVENFLSDISHRSRPNKNDSGSQSSTSKTFQSFH